MINPQTLAYIDSIEPEHMRTSCGTQEEASYNAAFVYEGTVHNKCNRCTLMNIANLAVQEPAEPDEDED